MMKDFVFLKVLDKLHWFFDRLNIDYPMMRNILQVKLIMDGRRSINVIETKEASKEENNFSKTLLTYLLFGIIPILFMFNDNYLFSMSLVFMYIMFILITALISDFSAVLLDTKDNYIIFSRPVSNQTVTMAKILHIIYYLGMITISLAAPSLVVSLYKHGLSFFLLYLGELFLVDLLVLFCTVLLYLAILRFFSGEKLKDIINYFQIGFSLLIVLSSQVVGRLFNVVDLEHLFKPAWWQYFLPPIWFSAPFELLVAGNQTTFYVTLSILALVGPILAIVAFGKLLPMFETNLQKLSSDYVTSNQGNKKWVQRLASLVCFTKEERIFFLFSYAMMKQEREFKLKVYPSLAFAFILPFISLYNKISAGGMDELMNGNPGLYLYFSGIIIPSVVLMMRFSNSYKGAWVYLAIPLSDLAPAYKGALKALLSRLFLPIYLFHSLIFVVLFSIGIWIELVNVFLSLLLFIVLCFKVMKRVLPFSLPYESMQQQQNRFMVTFFLTAMLGVMAIIQLIVGLIDFGPYLYTIVLLIANGIVWKVAFRSSSTDFLVIK